MESCAGTGVGRGTYEITRGTHLFRGATGKATFTFDFAFVGETRNGECVEDHASGVFFAKLTGNLTLSGSAHR